MRPRFRTIRKRTRPNAMDRSLHHQLGPHMVWKPNNVLCICGTDRQLRNFQRQRKGDR